MQGGSCCCWSFSDCACAVLAVGAGARTSCRASSTRRQLRGARRQDRPHTRTEPRVYKAIRVGAPGALCFGKAQSVVPPAYGRSGLQNELTPVKHAHATPMATPPATRPGSTATFSRTRLLQPGCTKHQLSRPNHSNNCRPLPDTNP